MEGLADALGAVEFFVKLALSWIVLGLGLFHIYRLGRQPWQDSALAFLLVAASFLLFDSLDVFRQQPAGAAGVLQFIELSLELVVVAALLIFGGWSLGRLLRQPWQDSALAFLAVGTALLLISSIRTFMF